MPDLETLLREVRPVPDGVWAARLDSRVAARFPGPVPRWKRMLDTFRAHFLAFGAVATVATFLIVVISSVDFSSSSDDAASSDSSAQVAKAMATPAAES